MASKVKEAFDDADVESELAKEESKSKMRGASSKQMSTQSPVSMPESIAAYEVQQSVRTMITHNKGGKWEYLKPPSSTHTGKIIDCYEEDGCNLHLEIYSTQGAHAPLYASESAVGVAIGTGNIGG